MEDGDMDMKDGHVVGTNSKVIQHGHAARTTSSNAAWTCCLDMYFGDMDMRHAYSMDMDMQHEDGHAAWTWHAPRTWTFSGHRYAARIWGFRHGHGHSA
jgi:hypothetical protein